MHTPIEYGQTIYVNNLSTCPRWSYLNHEVLGFPKRPHLPPSGTNPPRNDVKTFMVGAKSQK